MQRPLLGEEVPVEKLRPPFSLRKQMRPFDFTWMERGEVVQGRRGCRHSVVPPRTQTTGPGRGS